MTHDVGAVVVGGDFQGLGIARSLGRRGVPVCVVDDEGSIARFSRYVRTSVRLPGLRGEEETVGALVETAGRLGLSGWVLYPTREETVAAIARNRDRLTRVFRVPTPGWETVRFAWDKRNTYRLAEQLGVPAPRTWIVESRDDVARIDADPPFAVKPAIKEHFVYATKAKAWRADSKQELTELVERASALVGPGEVMVQELVPGNGEEQFAYCAFFKDGEAVGSMVARRRRQHPPEFGRASTFVETVELPELEEPSLRFLRAIDYYGLVELEYKRDPRDGAYKLLDVNARTWGYHALGQRAGVDFQYLLYADQLGLPLESCRSEAGIRWIRLVTDVPTGLLEIARGGLSCRSYLRSLRGLHAESVFSRDDPWPGIAELALLPYLFVRRGF
jgi:predicted ATP-grasp superfamily ATP-dependent carboligase